MLSVAVSPLPLGPPAPNFLAEGEDFLVPDWSALL